MPKPPKKHINPPDGGRGRDKNNNGQQSNQNGGVCHKPPRQGDPPQCWPKPQGQDGKRRK